MSDETHHITIDVSDPAATFGVLVDHMTKDDMRVLGRALLMWVDKVPVSASDLDWAEQIVKEHHEHLWKT